MEVRGLAGSCDKSSLLVFGVGIENVRDENELFGALKKIIILKTQQIIFL